MGTILLKTPQDATLLFDSLVSLVVAAEAQQEPQAQQAPQACESTEALEPREPRGAERVQRVQAATKTAADNEADRDGTGEPTPSSPPQPQAASPAASAALRAVASSPSPTAAIRHCLFALKLLSALRFQSQECVCLLTRRISEALSVLVNECEIEHIRQAPW